jgi:lipopolysaccharide/colanic/teichoic acid biosynthesis glycosyltransferase
VQRTVDNKAAAWVTPLSCKPIAKVAEGIPRPVEAILALVGLVGFAPLIAISALAIRLTSPGTVFFSQMRAGRNGRSFVLVKLRTMRSHEEGPQVTSMVDSRVTLVGRFLRKTKLDELPELWNVLKGDMSLVGPRPEVPRYVDLKDPRWQAVLQARPGLTDPVTLRLRNEEKLLAEVEGDVERFYLATLQPVKLGGYLEYLGTRNWKEDLKVILKTAVGVAWASSTPAPTVAQVQLEASALNEQSRTVLLAWRFTNK